MNFQQLMFIFFCLLTQSMVFGQNQKTECFDSQNDSLDGLVVLASADKMPEFNGGERELIKYLKEKMYYPTMEKTDDIQFTLFATFVVDKTGAIRNSCILSPQYPDSLTEIELQFLKAIEDMPPWKPGLQNGKKATVRFQLSLNINWK